MKIICHLGAHPHVAYLGSPYVGTITASSYSLQYATPVGSNAIPINY